MKYKLRHFENNWQALSSLGYVFIIIGIVNFFISPWPVAVVFLFLGIFCVWFQLRGKRILVDTDSKTVKSGGEVIQLKNPTSLYMNEVRVSQQVSSRGSSTNVKTYHYKAFIEDGDQNILISCNGNDSRDMQALRRIAEELGVPFHKNYE